MSSSPLDSFCSSADVSHGKFYFEIQDRFHGIWLQLQSMKCSTQIKQLVPKLQWEFIAKVLKCRSLLVDTVWSAPWILTKLSLTVKQNLYMLEASKENISSKFYHWMIDQRNSQAQGLDFNLFIIRKLPAVYRRRPRRPPFLRVESDGIGVTSSGQTKNNKKLDSRSFVLNSFYLETPSWGGCVVYRCVRSSCRTEPALWEQTELQDRESLSWNKRDTV